MDELLSLKWNNHCSTFLHVLCNVRNEQKYTDVTLVCAGKFYSAHKLVLSSCSDYFGEIFDQTDCKNLVILLKDIKSEELEALLDYMYIGEVNVRQADLASLIKAAECLQIRGLAVADEIPAEKTSKTKRKQTSFAYSPIARRKRKLDEQCNYGNSPPQKKIHNQNPTSNADLPNEINLGNDKMKNDTADVKNVVIKEENDSLQHEVFSIVDEDYFENDLDNQPIGDDEPFHPLYGQSIPGTSDTDNPVVDNIPYPGTSYHENNPIEWQGDESNSNLAPSNISNFDTFSPATKKHQCPICSRNFTRAANMRAHLIIHSGIRRFSCDFCNYKANRRDGVMYHIRVKHPEHSK